jgi:Fic family protein
VRVPGRSGCFAVIPPAAPRALNLPETYAISGAAHAELTSLAEKLAKNLGLSSLVLFMLNRREAVESSQIEGTSTTFDGLLLHEGSRDSSLHLSFNKDAAETLAYVDAYQDALLKVRSGGLGSLNEAMIRKMHRQLMYLYPEKTPGQYKEIINYIGGFNMEMARFIPAPPTHVKALMEDLIGLIDYQQSSTLVPSILMRAAIVHAQFESIHPFLDGNGRTGRMLIPLMLEADGYPGIHLATFLKLRRQAYYDALLRVQMNLDWTPWLKLFYECVVASCRHTRLLIDKMDALQVHWLYLLDDAGVRRDASARKIAEILLGRPVLSANQAKQLCSVSFAAANNGLEKLLQMGVVSQRGDGPRNRVFQADQVLALLYDGVNDIMDTVTGMRF